MRTATRQRETHAATQCERGSLASAPPAGGFAADGFTPQTPHGGAVNYAPRAHFLASLVYRARRHPRRRPDANAQRRARHSPQCATRTPSRAREPQQIFPPSPQANTARRNAKSCAAFITLNFASLTAARKPTAAL